MDKKQFINFVQQVDLLSDARKKELIDAFDFMTEEEREYVIAHINETRASVDKNRLERAEKLMSAAQEFYKDELPKIMKEKEAVAGEEEAEEAEDLLSQL